jgi:hypothetical protein
VFSETPTFEYACEGDEDFCDPQIYERVSTPETDIVATWARVDGDNLIVDVRFRGLPFRRLRTQVELCTNWKFAPELLADEQDETGSPPYQPAPWSCEAVVVIGATDSYRFPLSDGVLYPEQDTHNFGVRPVDLQFDGCSVFISSTLPYVRYVLPMQGMAATYLVTSHRLLINNAQPDASVPGLALEFVEPHGGAPDEQIEFISICDMTCEQAGGEQR